MLISSPKRGEFSGAASNFCSATSGLSSTVLQRVVLVHLRHFGANEVTPEAEARSTVKAKWNLMVIDSYSTCTESSVVGMKEMIFLFFPFWLFFTFVR
jgi:hypothetical protein